MARIQAWANQDHVDMICGNDKGIADGEEEYFHSLILRKFRTQRVRIYYPSAFRPQKTILIKALGDLRP